MYYIDESTNVCSNEQNAKKNTRNAHKKHVKRFTLRNNSTHKYLTEILQWQNKNYMNKSIEENTFRNTTVKQSRNRQLYKFESDIR